MNCCRETTKMDVPPGNRPTVPRDWFRGVPGRYVVGADTRGRQEGRPYPWSQQVIHEISTSSAFRKRPLPPFLTWLKNTPPWTISISSAPLYPKNSSISTLASTCWIKTAKPLVSCVPVSTASRRISPPVIQRSWSRKTPTLQRNPRYV